MVCGYQYSTNNYGYQWCVVYWTGVLNQPFTEGAPGCWPTCIGAQPGLQKPWYNWSTRERDWKAVFWEKNMRNKYLGFYCNFAGILLTCYSAWNLLTCYYSSEHKRQKNADQFSNMGCHTISLHETKSWSWRIGESANMDLRWCGSSTRFMAVDYLNLLFGIWPKIFPGMGSWLNRNSWSKKLGHF